MISKPYGTKEKNVSGRIALILLLLAGVLAVAYTVYKLFFIPDPLVKGTEAFDYLPLDKTVTLQGENLKSIEVTVSQNGRIIGLLKETPEAGKKTYELRIKPAELGLSNGPAVVSVRAKAGPIKKLEYDIKATVDIDPPVVEVLKAPETVNTGSTGFALFSVKDADSVFIKLGDRTFTAFEAGPGMGLQNDAVPAGEPYSAGSRPSKRSVKTYFVFFAAPFDIKQGSIFYAVAKDIAGNQDISALSTRVTIKNFRSSSIEIDDVFINSAVSSILNETTISDPAAAFKKVNEEFRRRDQEKIIDISGKTEAKMLWEGSFLPLRNGQVMAAYGDERTYLYKGKKISESVHLGYDLASNANSPVEAANTGIVRFAGDLGIYGNAVLIDHGLGLMSLYGHLSTISVAEGRKVTKGEVIGKTGSTGLAGGDHLHFGILVHGCEVSPIYWWDQHWIKVNITDYIS